MSVYSLFILLFCFNRTFAQTDSALVSLNYPDTYSRALVYFNDFKYKEAIDLFRKLVAYDPEHPLSDNCQYWIGEAYYGMKQYEKALAEFQNVFHYPDGNKYSAAQFKIGMCYRYLGMRSKERDALQKFIDFFPSDPNVSKAKEFLQRAYQKEP